MTAILDLTSRIAAIFAFLIVPAGVVALGPAAGFDASWAASVALMSVLVARLAGISTPMRIAAAAGVGLFALLNVALATSFAMQGTGFNTAFFTHLDLSTLSMAWRTDAARLVAAMLYVVAAPVVVWAVMTVRPAHATALRPGTGAAVCLALLLSSLVLNTPLRSLRDHHGATTASSQRLHAEIAELRAAPRPAAVEMENPRNLVLIYLESVEATYLDATLFPNMLPGLEALEADALRFTDMRQYPGTGWTIAGLVGSQCGVPLLTEGHGNMILTEVDNPFSEVTCLAEHLKRAGYGTVYLGGATLGFAGKGDFLTDNGFDVALGIDELPNVTTHGWGMYDGDLLGHAISLFDELSASDAPFLLTMLTLDTHHPTGTPSPGCRPYAPDPTPMLQAVHCADQLVADLIDRIRASDAADETVIAVVSDHLVIAGEIVERLSTRDRGLLFWVLDPRREGEDRPGAGTHFDIAPTLLDALGMPDVAFPFGQSLLAHDEGRAPARDLSERDFRSFTIEALVGSH